MFPSGHCTGHSTLIHPLVRESLAHCLKMKALLSRLYVYGKVCFLGGLNPFHQMTPSHELCWPVIVTLFILVYFNRGHLYVPSALCSLTEVKVRVRGRG